MTDLAADSRAIVFNVSGIDLTGATVTLRLVPLHSGCGPVGFAGTIANPSNNPTLSFDLLAAITSLLRIGDPSYEFKVVATLADGQPATLARGKVCVRE